MVCSTKAETERRVIRRNGCTKSFIQAEKGETNDNEEIMLRQFEDIWKEKKGKNGQRGVVFFVCGEQK